jgi:hypothetical protein
MMRHDETRARREARAEAFEEAARICDSGDTMTDGVSLYYARKFRLIAAAERAAHAPKPPGPYLEAPGGNRACTDPPSARESITDCVEDGWTTEHVTLTSYPFEALDPWPDNPAEGKL